MRSEGLAHEHSVGVVWHARGRLYRESLRLKCDEFEDVGKTPSPFRARLAVIVHGWAACIGQHAKRDTYMYKR